MNDVTPVIDPGAIEAAKQTVEEDNDCDCNDHKVARALVKADTELQQLSAIAPIGWQQNLKNWQEAVAVWRERAEKAEAKAKRLEAAFIKESHDVEQILAKALGYKQYGPDGPGNPNDYCVGDHVPASLAMEASDRIAKAEAELAALKERYSYAILCLEQTELERDDLRAKVAAAVEEIRIIAKKNTDRGWNGATSILDRHGLTSEAKK